MAIIKLIQNTDNLKLSKIKDLYVGQVFKYLEHTYLKLGYKNTKTVNNCFRFDHNQDCWLDPDNEVLPAKTAELNVTF